MKSFDLNKELLGIVLKVEIQELEMSEYKENHIRYFEHGKDYLLNVYELINMMKEWASTKGYCIIQDTRGYTKVHCISSHATKYWEDDEYSPSRVIDCCEWILKREGIANEM